MKIHVPSTRPFRYTCGFVSGNDSTMWVGKIIPTKIISIGWTCCLFLVLTSIASAKAIPCDPITLPQFTPRSPTEQTIAEQLGWVQADNRCGGYYIEEPFLYPESYLKSRLIKITSDQLMFSKHGTSLWKGGVTVTRYGQEILANKAYLYRDSTTGEPSRIELEENVHVREPNTLIIARSGQYNLKDKSQYLQDLLYRTAVYSNWDVAPGTPSNKALQKSRTITQLSAWGRAKQFIQNKPKIYEFKKMSYTTCPPTTNTWEVQGNHLILNKETGRGEVKHARLLIKGIPVYYTPYLNFPIDHRRQTGFLPPTFGGAFSESGPAFAAPFYWNLAPNYDTTITPIYLAKRGVQGRDLFRYLTPTSRGNVQVELIPHDAEFADFQEAAIGRAAAGEYGPPTDPIMQSELRRLQNASTARKSFLWIDSSHYNDHWSSDVNFNYVSDDYYLRDFSTNLDQVTKNQILQTGQVEYKGQNWNFVTRGQAYQTLHPVDVRTQYKNAYTRLPQFVLNGDYPDQLGGLEYFIGNDLSHFDTRKNPGDPTKMPVGDRLNIQPGISRPVTLSYMTLTPRLQYAMTKYQLGDIRNGMSKAPSRTVPIFDINTAFYFDRNIKFVGRSFQQTLEPQVYYAYVPFRNQNDLPLFDTSVNSLTYDQLFLYNRFSGLDRINDANRLSAAITTRFIDQEYGYEKIRAAIGQIFYFARRHVTLCSTTMGAICPDPLALPPNPEDRQNRSPLTGMFQYSVSPEWSATANTIWNPKTNQVDNQSMAFHYQKSALKLINLGYNFVRNGDILPGDIKDSGASNLSSTDFSFSWTVFRDWSVLGRWTQNWNHHHFQNLLFGLQYDSCCWAVRLVGGRFYTFMNDNNTFKYNPQFFIQFALKGLGNLGTGTGNPNQILSANVSGYPTNFGQDF